MTIPEEIIKSVKNGECNLFLGAMVHAPCPERLPYKYNNGPPCGEELSRRLARKCGYKDSDITNLQRVSLYFEYRDRANHRNELVNTIIEEISDPKITPSPALHMLASLPFHLVITTNYDQLFEDALRTAQIEDGSFKKPIVRIYNPDDRSQPDEVPFKIQERNPVVLKLHGDVGDPKSIVVTEEDYIHFIQRMSNNYTHPIHDFARQLLKGQPTLFIGYSLRDYNLRLLFRTLKWHMDKANIPLSYSVDPAPDNLIVSVWQKSDKSIVSFIEQDLWDFVPELYKQCTGKEYQP